MNSNDRQSAFMKIETSRPALHPTPNPSPGGGEQTVAAGTSAAVDWHCVAAAFAAEGVGGVSRSVRLPLHGVRDRDFRRLLRRLVGDARAAHAVDERHECHFVCHRCRRAVGGRCNLTASDSVTRQDLRLARADDGVCQHLRRLPRHQPHAGDVQEERRAGEEVVRRATSQSLQCVDTEHQAQETDLMSADFAALLYLASGVLFILALRGLSTPASSRQGNMFGMIGMAIAILTTSRSSATTASGRGRSSCSAWARAPSSVPRRRAKFP